MITDENQSVNNKFMRLKRGDKMKGCEVKQAILDAGLKLWQVAYAFGMNDGNFSRKLRKDFSEADTQKVLSIINELKSK